MLDTGCKRLAVQAKNRWYRVEGGGYKVESLWLKAYGAGPKAKGMKMK